MSGQTPKGDLLGGRQASVPVAGHVVMGSDDHAAGTNWMAPSQPNKECRKARPDRQCARIRDVRIRAHSYAGTCRKATRQVAIEHGCWSPATLSWATVVVPV